MIPTATATGTFEIRLTPQDAASPGPARTTFEKVWSGDLTGESRGEMLSVGDPATGTASYVALEVFTGTAHGRAGTLAFRQSGDMHAGQVALTYEVVPHSGTGDLTGLGGTLTLTRESGVHAYTLAPAGAALPALAAELRTVVLRDLHGLERELELYPDEASVWRAVPGQPNSAGTLILHAAGATRHFFGHVLAGDDYARDRPAEFARRDVPRAELRAELAAARHAVEAAFSRVTDQDLARESPIRWNDSPLSGRLALLHLATHLAYHLGQVDYHRRAVTGDPATAGVLAAPEVTP